jgi:hypothetical protein
MKFAHNGETRITYGLRKPVKKNRSRLIKAEANSSRNMDTGQGLEIRF